MPEKPIEQQIFEELLEGEFKGLKVTLEWEANCDYVASANWVLCKIKLNSTLQEKLKARLTILKEILRHELLHIKLEMGDSNPHFCWTAQQMKIIWSHSDIARINRELKETRIPKRIAYHVFMPSTGMTLTVDGQILTSTKPYMVATS